jgi:phosphoribosylglycinamide formyltransferase
MISERLLTFYACLALPGKYNGAKAIERAHADFMAGKTDETGVMIHYVS